MRTADGPENRRGRQSHTPRYALVEKEGIDDDISCNEFIETSNLVPAISGCGGTRFQRATAHFTTSKLKKIRRYTASCSEFLLTPPRELQPRFALPSAKCVFRNRCEINPARPHLSDNLNSLIRSLLTLILLVPLLAQSQPTLHIPEAAAGANFNVDKATNAYLATVPPARKAQSDSYFEGGYWIILYDFLFGAMVSLFLLRTRLSARLRDNAERITRRRPFDIWLYFAQYYLVTYLFTLPLAIYQGFAREHQYGLSNLTFLDWSIDEAKGLGLSIVFGGLAVMALLSIVRALPRNWHIWGAIAAIVMIVISVLVTPVFLLPLFNKYTVLSDAAIRDPILRLARQNGIPVTNVYESDASRQSNRVSANVSGFLGTDRITLNDNLLRRCSQEAILAVMGHEMGHYVLNHLYKMMAFLSIAVVVFFAILRWSLTWSVAQWGEKWGIRAIGDTAVIPLAVVILSALSFLYTPIGNSLVRTQEYEADIFGLNTARQPDGFAEAALILGEYRKLDPTPLEEMIFFDHPSGRTRIHAAMRWKAENLPK